MTNVMSPVNIDARKNLDLRAGDTVRVHQKIEEKGKTRIQVFEGLVLSRKHGTEPGATFTVRRSTNGYGVEKIYPLYSPMIDKIEIVKRSKVRRSKLYYIRRKAMKQISKRMKMMFVDINDQVKEDPTSPEATQDTDVPSEASAKDGETQAPEATETQEETKEEVAEDTSTPESTEHKEDESSEAPAEDEKKED